MLELLARGKVNLGLLVLGRRPDGYHEVDTILHALDLSDRVKINARHGERSIQVTCSHPDVPGGEANLAHRAAVLFLDAASLALDVTIHIDKRIPVAAGLGGGSADAAAVLTGLYKLTGARPDLHLLASALGADVPFFLCGPACRGRGTGTDLEPIPVHPRAMSWWLLLARPDIPVSTAWAYDAWDGAVSAPGPVDSLARALEEGDLDALEPVNDLEPGVVAAHPSLGAVRDALSSGGARAVSMSGSGSTYFGIFPSEEEVRRALGIVKSRCGGVWACVTRLARGRAVTMIEER